MNLMKRVSLLFIIAIFHLTVSAQGFGGIDFSRAFVAGKERRADIFKIMPVNKGCIEFVGGSIMEDCEWKELLNNPTIINRGIDGDDTGDVLNRTEELIRHNPSKVFLEIGTQDLSGGTEIESIVENIGKITQAVLESNSSTKVYVFSILPAAGASPGAMPGPGGAGVSNEDVKVINARLESLCKDTKMTYLDLYPHFLNEEKTGLDSSLGSSNSKLSVAGYGLLGKLLSEYVND